MKSSLTILAGSSALKSIHSRGLSSDHLEYIAGAAGGPKWLVLSQLDRAIFGNWLKPRTRPLFLVGSSIGAWRFAAAAQKNPLQAIDTFETGYVNQKYTAKPSAREVSQVGAELLSHYLPDARINEVLSHPFLRANILTVKCKNVLRREDKASLLTGFALASTSNAIHPKLLKLYFERVLFHDPRDRAPLLTSQPFLGREQPLTASNLRKAILASGSIPGVMEGVQGLADDPDSVFRDGGLLDYHLDLPYNAEPDPQGNNLVLFPHYVDLIKPNWFDKNLPWRRHSAKNLHNVVLISPSREFVQSLPLKRITDRNDFNRFDQKDSERIAYWKRVIAECQRLHDEFLEIMTQGKIAEHVRPLN